MPEATTLLEAVDRLADRFRSMPQSQLLGAVPGHPSRAAAGLALASELAAAAQLLEEGADAALRPLPSAGAFAVGDQLAVAGHDLVAALGDRPADAVVPTTDGVRSTAAGLLAGAVAAVGAVGELCS
ncbi:hypothetical protein P3T36_001380 [Kitasatospora sp. MAP12-15]|uniref:hypothetical protein n=1 Tax=unclassified Kitasatospora TaxID=2633591 RepID=UPI002474800E|nr:hypothetical protein [Kitasatospora sp. MAP12-44]MDH6112497.1 hypothetical protein [Kitasatospora sp. MAP12-44]